MDSDESVKRVLDIEELIRGIPRDGDYLEVVIQGVCRGLAHIVTGVADIEGIDTDTILSDMFARITSEIDDMISLH